jgi:hypothetical protein
MLSWKPIYIELAQKLLPSRFGRVEQARSQCTYPARQSAVNGERRSFVLYRSRHDERVPWAVGIVTAAGLRQGTFAA